MQDKIRRIANKNGSNRRHEQFEEFLHNLIKSLSRDIRANSSIWIKIVSWTSAISLLFSSPKRSLFVNSIRKFIAQSFINTYWSPCPGQCSHIRIAQNNGVVLIRARLYDLLCISEVTVLLMLEDVSFLLMKTFHTVFLLLLRVLHCSRESLCRNIMITSTKFPVNIIESLIIKKLTWT